MTSGLEPARTGRTSAVATISQQFFYGMWRDAPDSTAYYQTSPFVIDGVLDPVRFARVTQQVVESHEVFRTGFREQDGVLHQVVHPLESAPRFELELIDRSPVERDAWSSVIQESVQALAAQGWDLERGRTLCGRLIKLGPEQHALVIVFHHIVIDGGATFAFFRQLFTAYTEDTAVGAPALQYVDIADVYDRWSHSATGQDHAEYWRAQARGAAPVELPTDHPRAPVEARRDAAWHGIATDPMHPVQYVKLSPELREAVTTLARRQRVSIYGVYAAALFWLLHEQTGSTDLCVETTADMRGEHPEFADVIGVLVFWTLLRADLSGCASVRDALPRLGAAIADGKKHGPFPDYYSVVPHTLRRVVMNYLPLRWITPDPRPLPGIRIEKLAQPFPRWKRPWDLHLTVIDSDDPTLAWTGNGALFERATVDKLLARYIEILTTATMAA